MIPELNRYLAVNFPDSTPIVEQFMLGPPTGDVDVRFSGPGPMVLRELAEKAQDIMRLNPDATLVRNNWRQKVKVIRKYAFFI